MKKALIIFALSLVPLSAFAHGEAQAAKSASPLQASEAADDAAYLERVGGLIGHAVVVYDPGERVHNGQSIFGAYSAALGHYYVFTGACGNFGTSATLVKGKLHGVVIESPRCYGVAGDPVVVVQLKNGKKITTEVTNLIIEE